MAKSWVQSPVQTPENKTKQIVREIRENRNFLLPPRTIGSGCERLLGNFQKEDFRRSGESRHILDKE
jgi:hypothetical protein